MQVDHYITAREAAAVLTHARSLSQPEHHNLAEVLEVRLGDNGKQDLSDVLSAIGEINDAEKQALTQAAERVVRDE